MLDKPIHALCSNRSKLSSTGKTQNMVNSLLSDDRLGEIGLSSIDFDFFVNWEDNTIANEIWIKRIVDSKLTLNNISSTDIAKGIKTVDTNLYLKSLIDFSNNKNIILKYKLFHDKDLKDWEIVKKHKSQEILEVELNKNGLHHIEYQTVEELISQIQTLSGGPLRIGDKGLTYSTSTLECYLSNSTAPWPGDADCIIMDAHQMLPLVLIELKKHTLNTSEIESHTYEKYIKGKDYRKYHRLALLAHHLQIPFTIFYYSTKQQDYILVDKLEVIVEEEHWELRMKTRDRRTYPLSNLDYKKLIYFLIN